MTGQVLIKNYDHVSVNVDEIFRYAGIQQVSLQDEELIKQCFVEAEGGFRFRVCYSVFPVQIMGDDVQFGFAKATSKHLAKHLANCDKAIVFCATIGLDIDRLIAKYGVLSPAKALAFQAIGAERIESLCELFDEEMRAEYNNLTPRFSPGYGDLDLAFQSAIFSVLDCSKKIGVTLTNTLLMTPSKSVTAIMGISNKACGKEKLGCKSCNNKGCGFRRE